ncbi:hypothetical protein M407DRAFT_177382 [Tulasnella calospora MUT 4182]|uniref:Uncharacterized protein n=1 Tax=Tulasnella calospora MUT 4182 TaxID=1051891 RepID=A0A0C3MJ69_9AGAM|nr:hypothetical protein M407DRAFT_177382 [Tulasnella calospora MUT 4182]
MWHDRETKELRALQMDGRTDAGEKFEIRRSNTMKFIFFVGWAKCEIAHAMLQLLDAQGLPKGVDPVRDGDSFTSWNVTDENILQAIPRDSSQYPITLYSDPAADNQQYPRIRAHMDAPSRLAPSSLRSLTLKLEEI